jgi:hypothetical protein
MPEALVTDGGCRPIRETPDDVDVHDRLDPTALEGAVALHAARDEKRHAARRMARAAVSREVARRVPTRASSHLRSQLTQKSTAKLPKNMQS